eukprot:766787-Hanusia_phi.AAC.2
MQLEKIQSNCNVHGTQKIKVDGLSFHAASRIEERSERCCFGEFRHTGTEQEERKITNRSRDIWSNNTFVLRQTFAFSCTAQQSGLRLILKRMEVFKPMFAGTFDTKNMHGKEGVTTVSSYHHCMSRVRCGREQSRRSLYPRHRNAMSRGMAGRG